jgi:hypothetical protein
MIVHIVFFKFNEDNKASNIQKVKEMLESLVGKIEPLNSMEVGVNFTDSPRAFDMSLYSTFESKDGLKTYATHDEHLKVLEFIKTVVSETKVVDYEVSA